MTRRSMLVPAIFVGALGALATVSAGDPVIEDFESAPGVPGFDPHFNHFFHAVGDATQQAGHWSLIPFGSGFSLGMAPATDEVTFNLECSVIAEDASVTIRDGCGIGCTTVEFVGTDGSFTFANTLVGSEETFDTTGLGLGTIERIRLTSFEGFFIQIVLDVVEDPCRADLDRDGMIGFDDLLEVLAAWGMCP